MCISTACQFLTLDRCRQLTRLHTKGHTSRSEALKLGYHIYVDKSVNKLDTWSQGVYNKIYIKFCWSFVNKNLKIKY